MYIVARRPAWKGACRLLVSLGGVTNDRVLPQQRVLCDPKPVLANPAGLDALGSRHQLQYLALTIAGIATVPLAMSADRREHSDACAAEGNWFFEHLFDGSK